MRPLEIALLLDALLVALGGLLRRPWAFAAALLGLWVELAHFIWEGPRWQLAPLYLLLPLVMALLAWPRRTSRDRAAARWQVPALMLLLLLTLGSGFLAWAFPVPQIPAPTGPYGVGTRVYYWVDTTRTEWNTPDPADTRELMVQVWYPAAEHAASPQAPYLEEARRLLPAIARVLDLPPWMLSHLRWARTWAVPDAPPAEGTFPVIFFSHGWGGFRSQNTLMVQELVSYGYVVVAADHTYGAAAVVFPDGRVAEQNREALPRDVPDDVYRQAAQRVVATWSEDLTFILGQLAALPPSDPLRGHLDLERVAAFGHSTGGGTAAQFCAHTSACRGALLLDPWMLPVEDRALDDPGHGAVLILRTAEDLGPKNRRYLDRYWEHLSVPAWDVVVADTKHFDFSDLPMLSPLAPRLGLKGPIPGETMVALLQQYALVFFDRTLSGLSEAQAPWPAFPEATVVREKRP